MSDLLWRPILYAAFSIHQLQLVVLGPFPYSNRLQSEKQGCSAVQDSRAGEGRCPFYQPINPRPAHTRIDPGCGVVPNS